MTSVKFQENDCAQNTSCKEFCQVQTFFIKFDCTMLRLFNASITKLYLISQ